MLTMGWEDKWKTFIADSKISGQDLIKYFGNRTSDEKYYGYNRKGVDPEFIWKNLPNKLKTIQCWSWKQFEGVRSKGIGSSVLGSAKHYGLLGGFWFSPIAEEGYEWSRYPEEGQIQFRVCFSKTDLNPKLCYFDGESTQDDNYDTVWDVKDFVEFYYGGILSLEKCKLVAINLDKEMQIPVTISEKQFSNIARLYE